MHKYPRTPHLAGSHRQPGDAGLDQVPFAAIRGQQVLVTEKLDGANAGISFASDGRLRLQSRGQYLTGGPRERQFDLLKSWAATVASQLWRALRDRYLLYGEWLYATHAIFYDALPHYFCAFDVRDLDTGDFLSTPRRTDLLAGLPVGRVPALRSGRLGTLAELTALAGPPTFRTARWRQALAEAARAAGVDPDRAAGVIDPAEQMEGLYLRVERDGRLVGRCKWVRPSFRQPDADWTRRPIIANQLADPANRY